MAWHDDLDPNSAAYEIASCENPRVRVVAGPGTGKSFAMKRRVARLMEDGLEPNRILPVTFTRVAAEDLHRELVGMEVEGCDLLEGVTLHSLALRVLMRNHVLNATGRTPRPLNNFELEPLLCDLMGEHGGKTQVKHFQAAYEAAWARLQHEEPGYAINPVDAAFQRDLLAWLRFHRAMLIGEVIPYLYQYLRDNPAANERQEFRHILVDEFQDLNKAEQGVIELLSDAAEVCIVGDDDQSIYSFKYANPDGIREWLVDNDGAEDIGLDDCRRCPSAVVEMANNLIQHNEMRPIIRNLNPMPENGVGVARIVQYQALDQEVVGIAEQVQAIIAGGAAPGDILLLTQSRVFGMRLFEALVEHAIPVKSYYAESEINRPEAQRAFSILKLFVNRDDRVALRWLVGIGGHNWHAAGYRRVRDYCEESGASPWDAMSQLERGVINLPYTQGIVAAYEEIVAELDALEELPDLSAVVDHLFPEGEAAFREVREIATSILDELERIDRETLVQQLTTAITQPEVPTEIEDVRIMSLHKSKGLSAPITIIAGCVQGLLPRQPPVGLTPRQEAEMLEEQRRLFFVGITRVKASLDADMPGTLILTYSQEMPYGEARQAGIDPARRDYGIAVLHASQFLGELGPAAPRPEQG